MSEDAIMKFIMLVEVHFPRPKFNGDEKREAVWMRSMREILGEFEPDVLARAAETIVRTRDPQREGSMFPKPSECINACQKIISQRQWTETLRSIEAATTTDDETGKIRLLSRGPQNLPAHEVTRRNIQWEQWIAFLKHGLGRSDLAGEAERRGKIIASQRWPSHEAIIFEPDPKNGNLLSNLKQPQIMPK